MGHNSPMQIGKEVVNPGQRKLVMLEMPKLYDCSPMYMPVHVVSGLNAGPTLIILAAIHGDEINGVEIVRRLLQRKALANIRGTLIAVPVVNVYGFIYQSRYLMDRRDLNRAFPGSKKGSLTSRLAYFLMNELLEKATHVIDLHTGSLHRSNVPHVRASLTSKVNKTLAREFGAPVILNSKERDGSLRQAMTDFEVPYILYEAGEALRFSEVAINTGVRGIIAVMRHLKMIVTKAKPKHRCVLPSYSYKSIWVRSKSSGIMIPKVKLGDHIKRGDELTVIANPLSIEEHVIKSTHTGIIIGKTNLPLVHEGEALFHIAYVDEPKKTYTEIKRLRDL